MEFDDRESIGEPMPKTGASNFQFMKYGPHWKGGEPHVFTVDTEAEFPKGHEFDGAHLITVTYDGGGLFQLLNQIAAAAELPWISHIQVFFEYVGDLSDQRPVIVYVRHANQLLANVGPALLRFVTAWERYARHGNGVHSMYLVLYTGPGEVVNVASNQTAT